MEDNTPEVEESGLSRRDMLRRSALVGGTLVWAAPAVQTLATPAFAAGSPAEEPPPGAAVSEVTLLLNCGGVYSWAKYSPQSGSGNYVECKADLNVAESNTDATCTAAEAAIDQFLANKDTTGSCVNGTVTNGVLCIAIGDCTVAAWTIHDGLGGSTNHCAYLNPNTNTVVDNTNGSEKFVVTSGAGSICFSKVPA